MTAYPQIKRKEIFREYIKELGGPHVLPDAKAGDIDFICQ
jgi:hypothetical protein